MSAALPPWRPVAGGLELALKVIPGARRAGLAGLEPTATGGRALKLKVQAPPEDGRANAAVLAFLAEALALPRGAVTLVEGERDRRKRVRLAGDPGLLAARLAALVASC